MARDTGSPRVDAEVDLLRMRRYQTLSKLAHWMRQDAQDVQETLSFDEVVDALGQRGERQLGPQEIPLDPIVGCTDPSDYHRLAEMVEAWACRLMHYEGAYFDKPTMAMRWYDEEYTPVVEMIDEAGVRGPGETGADAYIRRQGALPVDPRARLEPRRHEDGGGEGSQGPPIQSGRVGHRLSRRFSSAAAKLVSRGRGTPVRWRSRCRCSRCPGGRSRPTSGAGR